MPETPNLCYIFEILMTHSFQIKLKIPHTGHPVHTGHPDHPGYPVPVIHSVLQGRVYHRFGIFFREKEPFLGVFLFNPFSWPNFRL